MSGRRCAGTVAVMTAAAWGLAQVTPDLGALSAAATGPQQLVDTAGPDALLLLVVPVLAWLCWAWGALGLLLTAATAAPGPAGRLARRVAAQLLPAATRRAAAVALGVGLSAAVPVLLPPGGHPMGIEAAAAADTAPPGPAAPDWPTAPSGPAAADTGPPAPAPPAPGPPAPDWPAPAAGAHVVLRGDCLWDIARDRLQTLRPGATVTDPEVQQEVSAWWQANAAVIGPDPDLLLPGQVLHPPAPPTR